MPNDGFLGAFSSEQVPEVPVSEAEAPQEQPELDEVALAEREAAKEMAAEAEKDTFLETAEEGAPTTSATSAQTDGSNVAEEPLEKDEITLEVERILEDGLGEYIPDMPGEAREKFIKKGGEVAGQVSIMVRSLNVQVKRVVDLIKDWLLTIPGVNRYFIEQEAKIKTDRIVDLVEMHRQDHSGQIPKA
jgi:hypothetical protein